MTRDLRRLVLVAGALGAVATTGYAQEEFDDFDSYGVGVVCPNGSWEEWDTSVGLGVCGSVSSEQAFSGSNSLKIVGGPNGGFGNDTVQRYDVNGGAWEFSLMMYLASSAAGDVYVILLDQYDDPPGTHNHNWSLQVEFNHDTNIADANFNHGTWNIVEDEWVEFKAVIDLDGDTVDYFYDGVEVVSDLSWEAGLSDAGGSLPQIQALDLYGNEFPLGTTGAYFDDVSMAEAGGDDCYADCNNDTVVNIFDFLCFQGLVTNGDPAADCNGDGPVNIFDFLCFQGAVTNGC